MSAIALPLIPLVGAALLVASRGRARWLGPIAVLTVLVTLAVALWAAAEEPTASWRWSPAISLALAVEEFGRVMVVLVPVIAAPIVAYAAVTEHEGRMRLLALMVTFVAAMLLLVTAADFLTLLIAWELVGATSWALIGHNWRDAENPRAAAEAFVTTRIGDLGLYLAAGITFAESGSFAYAALDDIGPPALGLVAAGVLIAAAAKSAQLPFSPWLFAAMTGPTPVSALLHSATLVAAGAYLLIRLAPALEPVGWFLPTVTVVGLTTAIAGGVVASTQTHVKRVLAGSTSAQYGLMFIAVGASSVAAGGAHLVAHAALKSLLFLGAGVVVHAVGRSELREMRLGRALPAVASLSAVGALALAAVPPLGAAWTKEQVVAAAVHASPWLATGVFAAALLSAFYAARYQWLVFGPREVASLSSDREPGDDDARRSQSVHPVALTSLGVLAATTLLLSVLWWPRAGALSEDLAGGELPPGQWWELAVALGMIGSAFGLVWGLWQRRRLETLGMPPRMQALIGDWLGLPAATRLLVVRPVFALSHLAASVDDRVIDAGVRAVAAVARSVSRLLGRFDDRVVDAGVRAVAAGARVLARRSFRHGEWTFDGMVRAATAATLRIATTSRATDDRGIDAAVEQGTRGVGAAAAQSRRLQTGMAHHYYVIAAAGLAMIVAILAVFR